MKIEGVPNVSGRQWVVGQTSGEKNRRSRLLDGHRGVEESVLAVLIEAHPGGLPVSAVRRKLTSVEDTPKRMAAIDRAIQGLIEVKLVVRGADQLRTTQAAIRAAELDELVI